MVLTRVRPVLRNGFGMPEQGKYGRINPIALCRYIAKRLWRLLRLGIQREVPPLREAAHVLYSSHEAFAGVLTHSWSLGKCSIEREGIDGAKPKRRPEWNARV